MQKHFQQTNKEALYAIFLTVLYFLWWYLGAYIPGSKPATEYLMIFGMPLWFCISCVAGAIIFPFLAWFMVHFLFKDIDLDEEQK